MYSPPTAPHYNTNTSLAQEEKKGILPLCYYDFYIYAHKKGFWDTPQKPSSLLRR